jgi:hypothetical protein
MFLGASVGPTAGALITKWTQIPLITYYVLLAVHLFTLIFIWMIVPESLAVTLMAAARRSRVEQQDVTQRAGLRGSMERFMSRATAFIRPLSLFLPVRIRRAAGKSVHWDWSVTLVAAASASIGLMQVTASRTHTHIYETHDYSSGWHDVQASVHAAALLLVV